MRQATSFLGRAAFSLPRFSIIFEICFRYGYSLLAPTNLFFISVGSRYSYELIAVSNGYAKEIEMESKLNSQTAVLICGLPIRWQGDNRRPTKTTLDDHILVGIRCRSGIVTEENMQLQKPSFHVSR